MPMAMPLTAANTSKSNSMAVSSPPKPPSVFKEVTSSLDRGLFVASLSYLDFTLDSHDDIHISSFTLSLS